MLNDSIARRRAALAAFLRTHPDIQSHAEVARQFRAKTGESVSVSAVKRLRYRERPTLVSGNPPVVEAPTGITADFDDEKGTGLITARSLDVKSLEDALAVAKVDLSVWEVERHVVNFWETTTGEAQTFTNCQVKVWLRRRAPKVVSDFLTETLAKLDAKTPPPLPKVKHLSPGAGKMMVEPCVFDPHFGMLAWAKETRNDWDTNIAYDVVMRATQDAISRVAALPVERVVIPFGNDWLHLDSILTETPKGKNSLEVDSRFPKIVERAEAAAVDMVRAWREVAPVQILWIPGNHDPSSSYMLARILQAWFSKDRAVTVDCSPDPHKIVTYGPAAIAFTHGTMAKRRDVSAVMMSRFREEFGRCKHFEVHAGHVHKQSETRISACETLDGGIVYRTIASLAGTDYWHYINGFHPRPQSAEMFIWHKEFGPFAHHSIAARWQ